VVPGDPQREVVRLAAGAGEHRVRRAELVRGQQPLRVVHEAGREVAGVRIERLELAADRLSDAGM